MVLASRLLKTTLLHLWLKFITFLVSQIITFMVKNVLHLWLPIYYIITFITFMVDSYYIYGWYYIL